MKAKLLKTTIDKKAIPSEKPFEIHDTEIKGFLLRVQPSGVKSFYLSYRNSEGARKRYCIGKYGSLSPTQAREIASKLISNVKLGIDIQDNKARESKISLATKNSTLDNFVNKKYSVWRMSERKDAEEELKRLYRNFQHLYQLPLDEIDDWKIEKWRRARIKLGLSPKTINRDLSCLMSVMSYAVSIGVLDSNPIKNTKLLKVDSKGIVRFFEVGEEKRLREALDDREHKIRTERLSGIEWQKVRKLVTRSEFNENEYVDHIKPMILLLINTGIRPSELLSLTWGCVKIKEEYITIDGRYAKNGRTRHIPLSSEAKRVLVTWSNQSSSSSSLVFPSPINNEQMDRLPRAITRLIRYTGLKDFRPYDLRHAFASKLAMSGVDLNTIRELLGHADISTTLIYAHLSENHKSEAINRVFS